MKILVTGTYSSGKTSFCNQLLRACLSIGLNACSPIEMARTITLPLNLRQDGELSSLLIGMQIARERELQNICDVLICDRGLPDIWSHNLMSESEGAGIQNLCIEEFSREWSKSYDIVIQSVVNEKIEIPGDGIRVCDNNYRNQLQSHHRQAMKVFSMRPNLLFDHTEGSVKSAIAETIDQLAAKRFGKISSTIV